MKKICFVLLLLTSLKTIGYTFHGNTPQSFKLNPYHGWYMAYGIFGGCNLASKTTFVKRYPAVNTRLAWLGTSGLFSTFMSDLLNNGPVYSFWANRPKLMVGTGAFILGLILCDLSLKNKTNRRISGTDKALVNYFKRLMSPAKVGRVLNGPNSRKNQSRKNQTDKNHFKKLTGSRKIGGAQPANYTTENS